MYPGYRAFGYGVVPDEELKMPARKSWAGSGHQGFVTPAQQVELGNGTDKAADPKLSQPDAIAVDKSRADQALLV